MRKRKFLVASLALSVAAAVGIASVATGAVTSQTVKGSASPSKQDKKVKGPISLRVDTDADFDSFGPPPGDPSAHTTRAVIHFPKDFAFSAGTLPQCDKASIANVDTAGAIGVCGSSQVGQGSGKVNGVVGPADAVVTAFNGVPVNGQQVIFLHARAGAPLNTTTVLTGVLGTSSRGGNFGRALDVQIDPLAGGYEVITHFDTTVNKQVVKKAKKAKKGKKKKPNTYYASSSCSTGTWTFAGDFHFQPNPGGTPFVLSAEASQQCQKKKAKKKKKK